MGNACLRVRWTTPHSSASCPSRCLEMLTREWPPGLSDLAQPLACMSHDLNSAMLSPLRSFVVGQVHKQLNHTLYAVHWVWSGSTMESKQQTIRDAMKFWDPPGRVWGAVNPRLAFGLRFTDCHIVLTPTLPPSEYYTTPSLVTIDMWVPEVRLGRPSSCHPHSSHLHVSSTSAALPRL